MSQSYASQASIRLTAPASGGAEVVESKAGALLQLGFDPQAASFERTGTDLAVKVDGGGILVLQGFFKVGDEPLPTFVLTDGGQIPAGTLLTSLDPNFDISTAAGTSAASSSSGSGEYDGDAGEGLAGLDRLGSLGTDQWGYDESVVLEPVSTVRYADSGLSAEPSMPGDVAPVTPVPPVPVPPAPVLPEPADPEPVTPTPEPQPEPDPEPVDPTPPTPVEPEPVNAAPVADDMHTTATEGGAVVSGNFNDLASDPDGDSLTLSPGTILYTDAKGHSRVVTAEEAGVTLGENGDWRVDPSAPLYSGLNIGQQGKLEIRYSADDGQASDEGIVSIAIDGVGYSHPQPDVRAVLYEGAESVSVLVPGDLSTAVIALPGGWDKGYAEWSYAETGRIDFSLTDAGRAFLESNPKAIDYINVTVGGTTYTVQFIAVAGTEFDSAVQNAEDAAEGLQALTIPGEFHSGVGGTYAISTVSGNEGDDEFSINGTFAGTLDAGAGNDTVSITTTAIGLRAQNGGASSVTADTVSIKSSTTVGIDASGTGTNTVNATDLFITSKTSGIRTNQVESVNIINVTGTMSVTSGNSSISTAAGANTVTADDLYLTSTGTTATGNGIGSDGGGTAIVTANSLHITAGYNGIGANSGGTTNIVNAHELTVDAARTGISSVKATTLITADTIDLTADVGLQSGSGGTVTVNVEDSMTVSATTYGMNVNNGSITINGDSDSDIFITSASSAMNVSSTGGSNTIMVGDSLELVSQAGAGMNVTNSGFNLIQAADDSMGITVTITVESGKNALSATNGTNTITGSDHDDDITIGGMIFSSDSGSNTLNTLDGDDRITLDGQVQGAFNLDAGAGENDVLVLKAANYTDFTAKYGTWLQDGFTGMNVESIHVDVANQSQADMDAMRSYFSQTTFTGTSVTCVMGDTLFAGGSHSTDIQLSDLANLLGSGDSISTLDLSGGAGNALHIDQQGFDQLVGGDAQTVTITGDANDSISFDAGWQQTADNTVIAGQTGTWDTYSNDEGDQLLISTLITNITTG